MRQGERVQDGNGQPPATRASKLLPGLVSKHPRMLTLVLRDRTVRNPGKDS